MRFAIFSIAFIFSGSLVAQGTATYLTIEVPGALETYPESINSSGVVAGYSSDGDYVSSGFVRSPSGKFISFAATGGGIENGEGTFGVSVNKGGDVTGYFTDSGFDSHGFVRYASSGSILNFDVPNAVETYPVSINDAGVIAGYYFDSSNSFHGFVRTSTGLITTFDDQFARPGNTIPAAINSSGEIAGFCVCGEGFGFIRNVGGTIMNFEAGYDTNSTSINSSGTVTGWVSPSRGSTEGYVRASDGTITDFAAPGADVITLPASINALGVITGSDYTAGGPSRGFIRTADGTFTSFDDPNAVDGTIPTSINYSSVIIGYYYDARNVTHGFMRTP